MPPENVELVELVPMVEIVEMVEMVPLNSPYAPPGTVYLKHLQPVTLVVMDEKVSDDLDAYHQSFLGVTL